MYSSAFVKFDHDICFYRAFVSTKSEFRKKNSSKVRHQWAKFDEIALHDVCKTCIWSALQGEIWRLSLLGLVMSMLIQPLRSKALRRWSPKVNCLDNFSQVPIYKKEKYSRLPITRTFKGNWKKVRVIGSSSYRGWNYEENYLKGKENWFELARVRVIGSRLYGKEIGEFVLRYWGLKG